MVETLIVSTMWILLCNIFHNVEIKLWIYRAVIALNLILYLVNLAKKNRSICSAKNVVTHIQFVFQKMSKTRYFCGRILARILRSQKVYKIFHVFHNQVNFIEILKNKKALNLMIILDVRLEKNTSARIICHTLKCNTLYPILYIF